MYRQLGEIELPLDQISEFGRRTELFVEIGFGNGSFIETRAAANPDLNCLGAELSLSSLSRAYRRVLHSKLPNIRLFRCDGRFLVRNIVGKPVIRTIAINFPDPWPRRRHADRRLLSTSFFELASDRLVDDGRICLATDDASYLDFARRQAGASGLFREEILDPPQPCLGTRYASKWTEENRNIHYVEFTITGRAGPFGVQLTNGDMHHAFLKGELPEIKVNEKWVKHIDTGEVIVVDVMRLDPAPGYVFAVMVKEQGLRQDVLVEVRPHRDGYHVGLRRFGSPILTDGVSQAVRLIAAHLKSLGMEIVDTWY